MIYFGHYCPLAVQKTYFRTIRDHGMKVGRLIICELGSLIMANAQDGSALGASNATCRSGFPTDLRAIGRREGSFRTPGCRIMVR